MKKHRLLIMSILLLLVSFVTAWYNDLIFHRLSFLVLPIYIILPVCFIALLVISIKRIGKRKEYVSFFSIAVLVLLVLLLVFFPFRVAKAKAELALYEADRLEIIEIGCSRRTPSEMSICLRVTEDCRPMARCSFIRMMYMDRLSGFGYSEACRPALSN